MIDLSGCNKFETDFYNSIISFIVPHFRDKQFVFPQKEFIDSSGKKRRIDFAIISKSSKIAIELDGYTYHAENVISRRAFDDQLNRQNDIIGAGYKVLRFSFDQFTTEPQKCADILRRNLLGDNELHPFLARQKIGPHMLQREALNAIENSRKKGKNAGLVVLATGLGKTHLAAFDAKKNASRILFIAHNLTILRQAQRTFDQILESKTSGLFTANEREIDVDMLFASIHSLYRNLDKFHPNDFDYIIFDEFHHAAAPTFKKVLQFFKPNFLLGLTATPNRTDRKSILPLVKRNIFYEMNADLAIERGFLVPFSYYGFSDNIDYSNIKHNGYKYDINDLNKKLLIDKRDEAIIEKYHEYAQGNKAIGFCVSIEHTERSVRKFNEKGIASVAIHSKLSQDDRKNRMLSFRNGEAQIAFVRDLFNEGVDVPDVSTLLFLRPTESELIFHQQLGRGLRLNNEKKILTVLDFVGNYINVENIGKYLASYGDNITEKDIKDKPILYYDNGCEVRFDQTAIKHLTRQNLFQVSDFALVDDFFRLVRTLDRPPFPFEIETYGEYSLSDYVTLYNTWDGFLARLIQLDPEFDISYLNIPNHLDWILSDSPDDWADTPFGSVVLVIEEVVKSGKEIETIYCQLGNANKKKIREQIDSLFFSSKNTIEFVTAVCFLLSKYVRSKDKSEKTPYKETQPLWQKKLKKKLGGMIDIPEAYIFPDIFWSNKHCIEALEKQINKINTTNENATNETDWSIFKNLVSDLLAVGELAVNTYNFSEKARHYIQ